MIDSLKARSQALWSRSALLRGGPWIDRWDEQKALTDEEFKSPGRMEVGAHLAFPDAHQDASLADLIQLSNATRANSPAFYSAADYAPDFEYANTKLCFRSYVETETAQNDIVRATIFGEKEGSNAIIILPHWNARYGGYTSFAKHLVRLGLTVVEMTLPYHGPRNREGAQSSDYFLSANLGRTIRSVRQSVIDCRCIVDWLRARGHGKIGLVGLSLGSCIGGLVAEHDSRIAISALFLTAGDFAEVVWTGRATRLIAEALAPLVNLAELRGAWSIISTDSFASRLARPDHRLLMISGRRDPVVLPYLTRRFVQTLNDVGADIQSREIGSGHYSIRLFPYNVLSFAMLVRFLIKTGFMSAV